MFKIFTYFVFLLVWYPIEAQAQEVFTIGGLFHEDNYQSEMAFKYSIARHNMFNQNIKFKTNIQRIDKVDSFSISKLACNMISSEEGVVAIFGPESPAVGPMVQSICANTEIPHLQTNFKPETIYTSQTVLNFHPEPELLSLGLATLIRHMSWKTYIILYENDVSLIRLQEVFKITTMNTPPVVVRQLSPDGDHRPLLKEIKQSTESNIILDCKTEHIIDVLLQAKEVGMLLYFYNYVLTSLDAHMLDYSILETSANITTIRLVNPENSVLHNAVRDWEMGEHNDNRLVTLSPKEITAEAALMHDAVNFFTTAFQELSTVQPIEAKPITCEDNEKWEPGFRLTTYMKVRPMLNSITGDIKFNEWGKRVEFTIEIVEIISGNVEKTAFWSPSYPDTLNFTRSPTEQMQQIVQNLQKTTVIVSSRLGPPYLRNRKPFYEGEVLEGNARYEGYSMDLIDSISKILNFTYRFELAEDGKYGNYDKVAKAWNGLIKDLLDRKAHLAICDLTINHQRREVVDFSLPFMTLGVSILYSKSKPADRNIFAFMEPLDNNVWIYIVSAYISVTLIMYLIARMAPGDWENPHPCEPNPEELENIWTLKNCLWLILGSTMSQGCDILPKGLSSRMSISTWWFFILIISSSYTANLAAFLTMDKMAPSIDSAEALAKQTKIKYGTVEGGSTQTFFKDSNYSTYARMWTQMLQNRPSVFEKNNDDGVKRVLTTKNQLYAFLMESSSLEYEVERNCDLKQVGGRMDSKGYGIAMPFHSPYRSAINKAVLKLQEDGKLAILKKKWWKDMNDGEPCQEDDEAGSSADLKLANVGGVFLVLGVGVSIALLFAFVDFFWNVHRVSIDQKISYTEALIHELRFAVKFWITEKRTHPVQSESISNSNEDIDMTSPKNSVGYNSLYGFVDSKK